MKHLVISAALIFGVVFAVSQSAMAQWEPDQRISRGDSGVTLNENMGQCLAASGDSIHLVWCNPHSNGAHIFYRHSFDGGATWAADLPIAGTPANTGFPSISVSGPMVHVAFRDTTGSVYTSYYVRSTDAGMTWQPMISLGVYFWWPSITSFGNVVYVALNDNHPGNTEVYFRRSVDNGMTWDTVQQISNALGRSEDPSITASGSYVYMAWNDNRTGIMQTWYRSSSDNGLTWGPETQRSHAATFAYFPMIHAVGPNVDIANGERLGNTYQIFFMHSPDFGATWAPEQQVTFGTGTAAYPTIARNDHSVDMVYSSFGANAAYINSTDGGLTWSAPDAIASAANKPGSTFIVKVGDTNHIIWLDSRNGFPAVYYKRSKIHSSANFEAPSVFDFGTVKLNVSRDTSLIVRNTGSNALTILGYALNDPHGVFELADTSLHSIAAQGKGIIWLRFHPRQLARDSAILTIATDEPSISASQIALYGSGADTLKQSVFLQHSISASMTEWPNPVTQFATLTLNNDEPMSNARIDLYDAAGRKLTSQQLGQLSIGHHSIQFDLSQMHGAIFARLFSGPLMQGVTSFVVE